MASFEHFEGKPRAKDQPSGVGEPRALLPCPFCGSNAEIVKNGFPPRNKWRHPSCTNETCPAHVVEQDEQGGTPCDVLTDEEARELWNTRTVAAREVGEGLREALERAASVRYKVKKYRYNFGNDPRGNNQNQTAELVEEEMTLPLEAKEAIRALAAPAPKPAPPDEPPMSGAALESVIAAFGGCLCTCDETPHLNNCNVVIATKLRRAAERTPGK